MTFLDPSLSRRAVLGLSLTLGASALVGCGSGATSTDSGAAPGAQVPAPKFQPLPGGPKPDIVGDAVLPDTFYAYPADPVRSVPQPPGDGKAISVLTQTYAPVVPPAPGNPVWQNLNDKLGSELQIQQVPADDYPTKFSTTVAGGQLPDMFFVGAVADLSSLIPATCLDLSDHLSGDNIAKYPNLAAIPESCWDAGRYEGRLYGLPSPRGAMQSGVLFRRDDLLEKAGVKGEFTSFDEFFSLAQQLNQPKQQLWATTKVPMQFIKNMLKIPNFWRFDGTSMQSWWTAPEYEQALEAGRRWVEAGLMHPDAFASPDTKTWFSTGKAYFNADSVAAWSEYTANAKGDFSIDGTPIPAFDGNGQGQLWLSFPSFGISAISKGAEARVETLLGVANYLAAPFGTTEYLDVKYGPAPAAHTLKGTDPILTDTGASNRELGVKYVADARMVNYMPGHKGASQKLDAFLRKLVPGATSNDAVYLRSKAYDDNFEEASSQFGALEDDILQGRKPVSAWRTEADSWWKAHGQTMSQELTEAYHAAGRG